MFLSERCRSEKGRRLMDRCGSDEGGDRPKSEVDDRGAAGLEGAGRHRGRLKEEERGVYTSGRPI